jgi:hypothetical protein
MGSGPLHHYDTGVVSHLDFQAIPVSFHVKDYDPVCEDAGCGVAALDILRGSPTRSLNIGNPVLDPYTRICMGLRELIEPIPPDK